VRERGFMRRRKEERDRGEVCKERDGGRGAERKEWMKRDREGK
jgi:hypothetical protein